MTIDRGNLWVDADPTRLEQVVVNLLNNASKYSEDGGHIRLSAGHEGDDVVIRVKDAGIGIPPEKIPEMFRLFTQGDQLLRPIRRGPRHRANHRREADRHARRRHHRA